METVERCLLSAKRVSTARESATLGRPVSWRTRPVRQGFI
jgi:hypothetical protein